MVSLETGLSFRILLSYLLTYKACYRSILWYFHIYFVCFVYVWWVVSTYIFRVCKPTYRTLLLHFWSLGVSLGPQAWYQCLYLIQHFNILILTFKYAFSKEEVNEGFDKALDSEHFFKNQMSALHFCKCFLYNLNF